MIKILPNTNTKRPSPSNALKRKKDKLYIVGGGPSIDIATLSNLKDGDVMAVNKSIDYLKRVDFFITIDYSFLQNKTDFNKLLKKADKTIFIANRYNKFVTKKNGYFYDTKFNIKYSLLDKIDYVIESRYLINDKHGFGLNYNSFANGENSGFSAIQLAILMEYKEIVLLGFDLKMKGSQAHFHNDYKNNNHFRKNLFKYQKTFSSAFLKLDSVIKSNFISTSKDSFLNRFIRYISLDTLITNEKALEKIINVKGVSINKNNSNAPKDTYTTCTTSKFENLMVVCYYTINTPYEQEKEKLLKSINKFGLASYIKGVPNLGDWQKNTRYKAVFLKHVLEKFPNKDILYIDADAEFLKLPDLFIDYACDIAIRWQDFKWRKNESLSGTIFMKNNNKIKILCNKWIEYNNAEYLNGKSPKTMEQWNLGKLILELSKSHRLIHKNLPPAYCSFDHIRNIYPHLIGNEVIVHYQASRRLRSKVNLKNNE